MQRINVMRKLLGVNIDHVATVRQARGTVYPSVIEAGLAVEKVGADSVTVHLREDRRHIQDSDVLQLKQQLKIPLNLELAANPEMVAFACQVRPAYCCIVPEKRQELTTEGGLDVLANRHTLAPHIAALSQAGIVVSLFIDPELAQIDGAESLGVKVIELHTGDYAEAESLEERQAQLNRITTATSIAASKGMQVNAGHGLNYANTFDIAAIPEITELNIGHAIIARAIFVGLEQAVQDMLDILQKAS
ncbi:MAG: pyridoxal phosphate biosynthetic protein PdxJ [Gammaproteobacteria bacterium]|jgi:pyridoxine 5-phosphate synthase|nr:pyridoxal phosphate biosynthetic protein PdxJ [Gammaproteobacteria bacterium]